MVATQVEVGISSIECRRFLVATAFACLSTICPLLGQVLRTSADSRVYLLPGTAPAKGVHFSPSPAYEVF